MTLSRLFAPSVLLVMLVACGDESENTSGAGSGATAGQSGAAGSSGSAGGSAAAGQGGIADDSSVPLSVRVDGSNLIDQAGRTVFVYGVNARVNGVFDVTFDDGRVALEDIPVFTSDDAKAMRDWGFSALRLPINWSAIEPSENGGINEAYLTNVEHVLDLCAEQKLRVLIDFHQDAYSKEIGEDGAPLWAIEPPPTMLLEGPLTDLGERRQSQQVLDAFSAFFGSVDDPTKESARGAELRDRFASMAAKVATRFKDHPALYGIELYNEPLSNDPALVRFHKLVEKAVHEVAPGVPVLFEPNSVRNLVDFAPLAKAEDSPMGPSTVYSPHIYTLAFTGSDEARNALTKDKLRVSHEKALAEAESWQAPLVVTEWGYGPTMPKAHEYFTWQSELADEFQESTFFWVWKEQSQGSWGCYDWNETDQSWSERIAMKQVLARIRPLAVAGSVTSFLFDRAAGEFTLKFKGDPDIRVPHVISIASILGAPTAVTCDGVDVANTKIDSFGELRLECGVGDSSPHELIIRVAPLP